MGAATGWDLWDSFISPVSLISSVSATVCIAADPASLLAPRLGLLAPYVASGCAICYKKCG